MHETFMSDSEDEGADEHLDDHHQQYKYMANDDLKTTTDQDHQNYDTTDNNDEHHLQQHQQYVDGIGNVGRNEVKEIVEVITAPVNHYAINRVDNVAITRPPVHLGFLVSFLVDARGGSMRGCRHSGVRIIVPPKTCAQPTRITCRYVKPQRVHNPPPLMEGEALVSRILELSPVEAKFLGPVVLEIPHFGALREKEREIIILRSDNGENWREHALYNENDEPQLQDILNETSFDVDANPLEDLHTNRIIRIVTRSFPQFFAVVSRIRQEVHAIGPDGGTVSSQAVPQVQAIFPPHALTKKIRVGLQAQPVDLNDCCKLFGQGVAVSPVVTVEPRRRKFHKAITLSIPAPKAYSQGMINSPYTGNAPTLRLLCSITGGQNRAVWEDVTGSTPLAFVKDSVTFTTTVSARFWLMDCRNITEASRMATDLYTYMAQVPFMVKFVIYAKRISVNEAKLSVFCMTDDREDKTLEQQEYFTEVAKSRDIEVLEDQDIYLEFSGHLVPVLKAGEQLQLKFQAFRENRLSFIMHVKDQDEPFGRISFMSGPKAAPGELSQQPLCALNISLAEIENSGRRTVGGSQKSLNSASHIDSGLNYRDLLNAGYKIKQKTPNTKITLTTTELTLENIHKADLRLSDISNMLGNDWNAMAKELGVPETDIALINNEYAEHPSQQAMVMLRLWLQQQGEQATGNVLEQALHKIGRSDIVEKCVCNVELVTDDMERTLAKLQLDQSGFEGLSNDIKDWSVTGQKALFDATILNDTIDVSNDQKQQLQQSQIDVEKFVGDTEVQERVDKHKNEINISDNVSLVQCVTPPSTPNPLGISNQYNDDMDTIRRIAEEHTNQVLELAEQNVNDGNYFKTAITADNTIPSENISEGNVDDNLSKLISRTEDTISNFEENLQDDLNFVQQKEDEFMRQIVDKTKTVLSDVGVAVDTTHLVNPATLTLNPNEVIATENREQDNHPAVTTTDLQKNSNDFQIQK